MYVCWCNKPVHKSTKLFSEQLEKFNNIYIFFNKTFRQKEASADIKQEKFCVTNVAKQQAATNALSSLSLRTVSPPLKRDVCATLCLSCCLYPRLCLRRGMAVHRLFTARNKTRCPSFGGCLTMGRAMSA